MNQEKHFINSIYYQLEQTAKYCKYMGNQLFERLNLPIPLDEFVILDTISIHGEGFSSRKKKTRNYFRI